MQVNYEELKNSYKDTVKDRPIIVIDSGTGGMAVTATLSKLKPVENFIFFADNDFMPLGNKNEKLISRRISKIGAYMKSLDPKAVILACNTLDSLAGDKLQALFGNVPVYRVIEPTAKAAVSASKKLEIGLLATTNTIESHKYIYSMLSKQPNVHLIGVDCPDLAYAIETSENLKATFAEEVEPLKEFDIDTIILGCTHYSAVTPMVKKSFGEVEIIDSSQVLIHTFIKDLETKLDFNTANKGSVVVVTTKFDDHFQNNLDKYFKDLNYSVYVEENIK